MDDTDTKLLARFVSHHAEDAFAEIVRRHLGLVYSAALRQIRSPQLAEEVAQSTFIKLARQAGQLAPDTILPAWLYQVTRREAIDVVRREASRQLREQIATEMKAMNATAADWTHIEPLLDEAMHALDDTDRTAVLLRYFENKSLREVGATLGTSENAAQKRLGRAVERLREFFAKRGITVGTQGLVVVISANAVQAAPVGLAVTLSTAAAVLGGTTLTATATATAAKAIAMTVTQKVLITAMLATAVGTAIYEARQASTLRREVQSFQQQQRTLAEQNDQLSRDRDDATKRLALLADQIARPPFGRQVLPVNAATVAGEPTQEPIMQDDVMNEHVKAVTGYTKAIEAEPKAFSPRFNRGVHYLLLQQYDNAIAEYTKIIDDPDMDFSLSGGRTNGISRAYEYRGRAYQNKKDYAKALADYEEALRFDPRREAEDETNIQWRRGLCYRALQQDDKALEVANLLSGRALQWAMAPGDMNLDHVNSAQTSARFANEILGRRGHRQPFQLEVCAAVAAKSGNFPSAVLSQKEALRSLAPAAEAQRSAMQARLELYEAGKPLYAK